MNRIPQQYYEHLSNIIKHYLLMNFEYRVRLYDATSKSYELEHIKITNGYPIVVLIGGAGGSGKSTFIKFCQEYMDGVYEESTIDSCKKVVDYIITLEENSDPCGLTVLKDAKTEKSDMYRTLLSKLKKIWCEADDGPNTIILNRVDEIINRGGSVSSLIFINVREPEQITHLKEVLETRINAVVLTLAVIRTSPESFENSSDRNTLNFKYDFYISNNKELNDLEEYAKLFCLAVKDTNL